MEKLFLIKFIWFLGLNFLNNKFKVFKCSNIVYLGKIQDRYTFKKVADRGKATTLWVDHWFGR